MCGEPGGPGAELQPPRTRFDSATALHGDARELANPPRCERGLDRGRTDAPPQAGIVQWQDNRLVSGQRRFDSRLPAPQRVRSVARISGSDPEDEGSSPSPAAIWRIALGVTWSLKPRSTVRFRGPLPSPVPLPARRPGSQPGKAGSTPARATICARSPTGRGNGSRCRQVSVQI